ncbi:MAG: SpoIID/LytB domain-containing protein [Bacteroidales bacterium]
MIMHVEPNIAVGILHYPTLRFSLNGTFELSENGYFYEADQYAEIVNGKILFNGDFFDEIDFIPVSNEKPVNFTLNDINHTYRGILRLIIENNELQVINILPIEEYLKSAVSAEITTPCNEEYLKAHTIVLRSHALFQLNIKNNLFDIHADDHYHDYHSITQSIIPIIEKAVNETCGELLIADNKVCDARFSKCCGGISEKVETHTKTGTTPLFEAVYDHPAGMRSIHSGIIDYISSYPEPLPANLTQEEEAEEWIRSQPDAFCNTRIIDSLPQQTESFYRWKVSYSQAQLSQLIKAKTNIDLGDIVDFKPLRRGSSGRITRLRIIGAKREIVIENESEIRRILAESVLPSSAFIVDKTMAGKIPENFTFIGAGYGHGMGLCQIGAAIMSEKGYSYREILSHYFRSALIDRLYGSE